MRTSSSNSATHGSPSYLPGLSERSAEEAPPSECHDLAATAAPMIVRVQLEDAAAMELDYLVPEALRSSVQVGSRVLVPLQRRQVQAVVIHLLTDSPHLARLKPVIRLVGSRPMFTQNMLRLAQWIADYYVTPVRQVLRTMLPEAVRNRPETFLTDTEVSLLRPCSGPEFESLQKRAPMQARLLETLHGLGNPVPLSSLRRELPRAASFLKPLEAAGWISRSLTRVERDPFHLEDFIPSEPLTLTQEQNEALAAILQALATPGTPMPLLLHGVTGSGKTEVYLQAIQTVLDSGKTALVLVPEISLTPQTIERFKARFSSRKERIAVLHSHLSDGERHDEWFKIHEGRADIVIGARSAIFAPLERLGIIIVDEEHEPSYKQEESPRYQARDVAIVRARLEGCAVVLGSATPSLESYENACRGK